MSASSTALPNSTEDRLQLEIHPGRAGLHVAARHLGVEVTEDDRRQDVQCCMGPHQRMAAFPIDGCLDGGSNRWGVAFELVIVGAAALERVGHGDATTGPANGSRVTRLPPAAGIEHGPVEYEALRQDIDDRGVGLA